MTTSNSSAREEDRIRAAYARRQPSIDKLRYSYFNQGQLFIVQERERRTVDLLRQYGFRELGCRSILEIGCGTAGWIREFIKWGARPENCAGVDLFPDRIEEAKRLCPGTVTLRCGSAAKLDFADASFDLVLQSTVFSSILENQLQSQIAREMLRMLKPQGAILWYDFFVDNPKNPSVRGVRARQIRGLFPDCEFTFRRVTLAPPLARALARHSWLLCEFLASLRILNTHYLVLIRRRG